jgi:prepilin-type processing-associated H-X9-DG protein
MNRAFTRLDLAVVLCVLTVVATLIVVPLERARRSARLETCRRNLGTVSKAILQSAADRNGQLPGPVEGLGEVQWWYKEQVKSYAGIRGPSSTNDTVFACPDDRGYTDPKPFHQSARFDYGSYCFNGVTLPGVPSIAGWPLSSVRQTSRTLLVMEWTAHGPLSWHRSRTGRRNAPFYRNAESVVAFVDGHVAFIPIDYDGFNAAYTRDPIAGYAYRYSGN